MPFLELTIRELAVSGGYIDHTLNLLIQAVYSLIKQNKTISERPPLQCLEHLAAKNVIPQSVPGLYRDCLR